MPDADQRLLDARNLALAVLHEITLTATVGPAAGYVVEEDGTVSLRFENRLPGYPGWYWTVTVARVEDEEPTVLEAELLPGDGALLAPEWVPWAERLAEYGAQVEDGEAGDDVEGDDQDDLDEDEAEDLLHAGDLDGVDIDELDESAPKADEDDVADSDEDEVGPGEADGSGDPESAPAG